MSNFFFQCAATNQGVKISKIKEEKEKSVPIDVRTQSTSLNRSNAEIIKFMMELTIRKATIYQYFSKEMSSEDHCEDNENDLM